MSELKFPKGGVLKLTEKGFDLKPLIEDESLFPEAYQEGVKELLNADVDNDKFLSIKEILWIGVDSYVNISPTFVEILRRSFSAADAKSICSLLHLKSLKGDFKNKILPLLTPNELINLYNCSWDRRFKEDILSQLKRPPLPELKDFYHKVFKEEGHDSPLFASALEALCMLEDPWVISELAKLLSPKFENQKGVEENVFDRPYQSLVGDHDWALFGTMVMAVDGLAVMSIKSQIARRILLSAMNSSDKIARYLGLMGLIKARDVAVLPELYKLAFSEDEGEVALNGISEFLDLRIVEWEDVKREIVIYLKESEPLETRINAAKFLLEHGFKSKEIEDVLAEGIKSRRENPFTLGMLLAKKYEVYTPAIKDAVLETAETFFNGEIKYISPQNYQNYIDIKASIFDQLGRFYESDSRVRDYFEALITTRRTSEKAGIVLGILKKYLPEKEWVEKALSLLTPVPQEGKEERENLEFEFINILRNNPQSELVKAAIGVIKRRIQDGMDIPSGMVQDLTGALSKSKNGEFDSELKELFEFAVKLAKGAKGPKKEVNKAFTCVAYVIELLANTRDPEIVKEAAEVLPLLNNYSNINDDVLVSLVRKNPAPFAEALNKIQGENYIIIQDFLEAMTAVKDPVFIPEVRKFFKRPFTEVESWRAEKYRSSAKRLLAILGDEEALRELEESYQSNGGRDLIDTEFLDILGERKVLEEIDKLYEMPLGVEKLHNIVVGRSPDGKPIYLTGAGERAIYIDEEFSPMNAEFGGRMEVKKGQDVTNTELKWVERSIIVFYGGQPEHGTAVASVIGGMTTGIAPEAEITAISHPATEVTHCNMVEFFIDLFDWVLSEKEKDPSIRVVGLSLGSYFPLLTKSEAELFKRSGLMKKFEDSIKKMRDAGISFVVSAGNKAENGGGVLGSLNFEALFGKYLIIVGSSNTRGTKKISDDRVSTFSSRAGGEGEVDLIAPGENILTTSYSSSYHYLEGTSLSQPFVSGLILLMYQVNPRLTPDQVKSILKQTAEPLIGYEKKDQGAGEVNPQKAVIAAAYLKDPKAAAKYAAKLGLSLNFLKKLSIK